MVLKRKRSDSEISTPSSSMLSSPPSKDSIEISFEGPFQSQPFKEVSPPQLSSRTRKRFRDNRPSEALIHQHTLSMLFSAQKNNHPLQTEQAPAPLPVYSDHTTQASLHSFWALPSRLSSCDLSNASTSSPPPVALPQATNCEDCDATLVSADGNAMDIDMDIDMYSGLLGYACSRCRKHICHQCSISNLGAERQCLICAGKRTWVGGIGWMDQD